MHYTIVALLGRGKIRDRSLHPRYKLTVFKYMLIISLEKPEYIHSSKMLSLVLLKIFKYIQATSLPLLII